MSIGLGYRPGVLSAAAGGGGGAGATPYTLTSITDIPPGAVDGEAGEFNGRIYVLTTLSMRAGAGGGTRKMWLPSEITGGTLEGLAYLVGDEDVTNDVALNAQGWPSVTRTGGTITTSSDRVRLDTGGVGNAYVEIAALTSGIDASSRFYLRWMYRATTGNQVTGAATNCTTRVFNGGQGFFLAMPTSSNVGKGIFLWTGSSTNSAGTEQASQPAIPNLTGTDIMMELVVDVPNNVSYVYRDGVLTTASRMISSGASDLLSFVVNSGSAATQSAIMDLSEVEVVSW